MRVTPGLVTTVIPVYNRPDMVREAVASVLAQTYRPIEIVLVDDGSTDATPAVLAALEREHPDVIRVATLTNSGPGPAREAGRRLARGEFLQYLDSDDLLLPRKFEIQVAALRARSDAGIAYGISQAIDGTGAVRAGASKWTGRRFDFLFPALLVDRGWHTHTPLYRRELCDRIGPWPAHRPEDWDYDARAGALRARLAYCAETVSLHRDHPGPRVTRWDYARYLVQDEAWFLPRLFACACEAGVPREAPEMRHFVRWAFADARRIGGMGHRDKADALLDVAMRASVAPSRDLRTVAWLARVFGWRAVGMLNRWGERLLARGGGSNTLPAATAGAGQG